MSDLTQWFQGAFLPIDLQKNCFSGAGNARSLVITHSCDIARESEIEIIHGKLVTEVDPQKQFAQNPRILHLELDTSNNKLVLELQQQNKLVIGKGKFENFSPDTNLTLNEDNLKTLQSWLAMRYQRIAAPDALNDRISPIFNSEAFRKKLKRPNLIRGIYISFKPNQEIVEDEPYEMRLVVVYLYDDDQKANAEASRQAEEVKTYLDSKINDFNAVNIFITVAIKSDHEFTLYDLVRHAKLQYDHFSLRHSPPGPTDIPDKQ